MLDFLNKKKNHLLDQSSKATLSSFNYRTVVSPVAYDRKIPIFSQRDFCQNKSLKEKNSRVPFSSLNKTKKLLIKERSDSLFFAKKKQLFFQPFSAKFSLACYRSSSRAFLFFLACFKISKSILSDVFLKNEQTYRRQKNSPCLGFRFKLIRGLFLSSVPP